MEFNAYIGLDVHKETIAVGIAETGRTGEVRFYGEIANTPDAVANLLKKLGGGMASRTSPMRRVPAAMASIARSTPRAMSARLFLPLTPRGA